MEIKELVKLIKHKKINFDEALIEFDKHGYSIGLVNNDNSYWAISNAAIQNQKIMNKKSDTQTTYFFFNKKKEFKNTPYEALIYFSKTIK
jgi:hypothetical protein